MKTASPKAILIGMALVLFGAIGLAYAGRTAYGQWLYHAAKYGPSHDNPDTVLALCARVQRLCPRHYYNCILAAETAYYDGIRHPDGPLRQQRIDAAERWCDRGLALNDCKSQLRWLKTQLLAVTSPARAVAWWQEFTNWQFWEPYNHAVLAKLQAQAGDIAGARHSLTWTRGSPYHAETAAFVTACENQGAASKPTP